MVETLEYASYLVRIWRERDEGGATVPLKWTAEVESIQTGESRRFSELAELIRFLQSQPPSQDLP